MAKNQRAKLSSVISILIIVSLACTIPTGTGNEVVPVANNAPSGDAGNNNTAVEPAATDTPEPVVEEPTPTSTVAHVEFPSDPANTNNYLTDRSTLNLASERRSIGDSYQFMLLERPFTSEAMDYLDHIDLTRGALSAISPWIYITLSLEGSPPPDGESYYGVEIDLDVDGRGDIVIFGKAPAGTDWTSENVYAYQDNNNDVGGTTPMRLDAPNSNWDGYETLVFDRGYGPDPDAAWIRRDPNNSNQIQLAFKFSLIDNDSYFMWGVWSWEGAPDPAVFDYHDHFTSAQAGSPVSDSSDYPLKEVAAMDNSCRWAYGFEPTGAELGVCYVQPTPTPTPKPGSISGGVFHDYDLSGSRDGGEPGLGGFTIKLGAGACGSTGYASTDTAGNGSYSFNNIPAGTYCVSVVNPGGGCSGWTLSTATQFTVHLDPGENLAVTWFGFYAPIC